MTAEFLLPALIIGGAAVICLANGIRVWRMTPWEYRQEQRRFLPHTALREGWDE